jgi:tripartite-type tricarboxylate transporter receptor subunit TctC
MTLRYPSRRRVLQAASLIGLAGIAGVSGRSAAPALAQEVWKPDRPIQVFIQFSAGGGTDTVTRTLLKAMEPILDAQINATNMTGALGSVATKHVLSQPADGYTWLGAGGFLDYPRIQDIDDAVAWEDFQFFQSATSLASWATHPDSQFKTFQDVIDYAKANPGKLKVSTDGVGGLWHEAMAIIALKAGFDFTNVPFDGGAPATLAALQGEVDIAGSGLHEQIQYIQSGQLRHLATFTAEPVQIDANTALEPVATFVPSAAANAPFGGMYNIALRRETPAYSLKTIEAAIAEAVESDTFQTMLKERFIQATVVSGEEIDKKAARLETERAALFATLGQAKKTAEELGLPAPEGFDSWWPPEGYSPVE